MNNRKTSLSSLVAPHLKQSADRVSSASEVPVVAHDTTQFRFDALAENAELQRTGLGKLSKGGQGFFLHLALAVTGNDLRDPLGVVGTHSWARPCPSGNEFLRWGEVVKQVRANLGTSPVIHVMDREADSYSLYNELQTSGERFVIRIKHDRRLADAETLKEQVSKAETVCMRDVLLSKRKADIRRPRHEKIHPPRAMRPATLAIAARSVVLQRPKDLSAEFPKSLALNVVHVSEPNPPEGQTPIQWWLATTESVETKEDIVRIVDAYRARWRVEEYFKALKSGCLFEQRQLETYNGLTSALGILLPVAWVLLRFENPGTRHPEAPASDVLTDIQIRVLRLQHQQKHKTGPARAPIYQTSISGDRETWRTPKTKWAARMDHSRKGLPRITQTRTRLSSREVRKDVINHQPGTQSKGTQKGPL